MAAADGTGNSGSGTRGGGRGGELRGVVRQPWFGRARTVGRVHLSAHAQRAREGRGGAARRALRALGLRRLPSGIRVGDRRRPYRFSFSLRGGGWLSLSRHGSRGMALGRWRLPAAAPAPSYARRRATGRARRFSSGVAYVRNPPQSHHTPASESGCTIFVKLWQFDPADRRHVLIDTNKKTLLDAKGRDGVRVMSLFRDVREDVRLEQ